MHTVNTSTRRQPGTPLRLLARTTVIALTTLATWSHAMGMTEADMVRQLRAKPDATAPSGSDDPDAVFANDGADGKNVNKIRKPDTNGACLAEAAPSANQKALVVIALAPSGAPQLSLPLQFGFSKYVLTKADEQQLGTLAKAMNSDELRDAKFTVAGHTDDIGDALTNQKLSCARALSARTFLIERGVADQRLSAYGFGSSRPVNANTPGAPENRRVEFRRAEN